MRHWPVTNVLMLMIALILALPVGARRRNVAPGFSPAHAALKGGATTDTSTPAKPFTQDQVQAMVRDGLGDETGAKAIEQRGIDFAPTEDFLQSLKAAGANEAFLASLRAAKHPAPTDGAPKKPLNQVQVFALLAGQVPSHRVTMLVQERGIDFDPTDDYLQEVRLAGGEDELVRALKSAKVTKPEHVDPALQARQTEARQHAARAAEFMRDKRYAEAEKEYRAVVPLDPQNADLYVAFGSALHLKGDLDGAIPEFREALRLDPKNENAHVLLGATLSRKGDQEGAIAEAREALRLNPNSENAHVTLGAALGQKGDLDGQIAEYRKALSLNPNNDVMHPFLGVALGQKGDWDGEAAEEREALRLNPKDENAHVELGVALGNNGDWDGAIQEYREALRLNPNDEMAHRYLGLALGKTGDWDGDIAEQRVALRLNPNDDNAHLSLGVALSWKGDWDGAIAEYHGALRLNPNNAEAHYDLGTALHGKGDLQGALQECRAAYELDPKNPTFRQTYEGLLKQTQP